MSKEEWRRFWLLDTKGQISHTKFFSVLTSFVMIVLFVVVVLGRIETDTELWLIIASTLLANRTINKFMEYKYTKKPDDDTITEEGLGVNEQHR